MLAESWSAAQVIASHHDRLGTLADHRPIHTATEFNIIASCWVLRRLIFLPLRRVYLTHWFPLRGRVQASPCFMAAIPCEF